MCIPTLLYIHNKSTFLKSVSPTEHRAWSIYQFTVNVDRNALSPATHQYALRRLLPDNISWAISLLASLEKIQCFPQHLLEFDHAQSPVLFHWLTEVLICVFPRGKGFLLYSVQASISIYIHICIYIMCIYIYIWKWVVFPSRITEVGIHRLKN